MRSPILSIYLAGCTLYSVSAFTLQPLNPNKIVGVSSTKTSLHASKTQRQNTENSRRSFLTKSLQSYFITGLTIGLFTTAADATLMDSNIEKAKTFKLGEKLSPEDAKQRFKDAIVEVDELIENYSDISKGGGDAVRRYLGTVGVEKKMYGITKVLKELREEADDIVEYTELANEFEAYLYQAEGAAYQSLFVEHSSAKGTPETFLATAKKDVLNMRKFMGELATQLNL